MNFTELIKKRHTTKDYIPGQEIIESDLASILEASLLAPTALGAEQVRVLVFKSAEGRKEISKFFLGANASKVENGSALVVFIGEQKEFLLKDDAKELIANMNFFDFSKPEYKPMLEGTVNWYKTPISRHENLDLIGAGNKSSYLTLRATELGYDTTIMTGILFKEFEEYLMENNLIDAGERVVLGTVIGRADPDSEINKIIASKKNRMDYHRFVKLVK